MKVTTDSCLFGAWVANKIAEKKNIRKIIDIGTGTGLLSLMIIQQNPFPDIDAIEINADAAAQAKENILNSPWPERIRVIYGDVKQFAGHGYDVVISNPPFYENELRSPDKKKNLAHHGDELTLDELLSQTKSILAPGGYFYFLLPFKREIELKSLFQEHQCTITDLTLVKQSVTHGYFRIMIEGTFTNEATETEISEIEIKDKDNTYTAEFTSLLKDYYLYL